MQTVTLASPTPQANPFGPAAVHFAGAPCDLDALKRRLYDDFKIEIPLVHWNGRPLMRISIQGYNTQADVERLVAALSILLPQLHYE